MGGRNVHYPESGSASGIYKFSILAMNEEIANKFNDTPVKWSTGIMCDSYFKITSPEYIGVVDKVKLFNKTEADKTVVPAELAEFMFADDIIKIGSNGLNLTFTIDINELSRDRIIECWSGKNQEDRIIRAGIDILKKRWNN